VSTPTVERAAAKINLTLRVVGRREDGYHALESLVVFADLADTLGLAPGGATTLDISGPFAEACGTPANNLVLKAVAALGARVPGLKAGRFHLEKNLPVAAGIGGGSADAAAALRLLARLNAIALDDPRLSMAALAVGADVPVCLASRARVMRGIGEQLSEALALTPLPALLVNPGTPLSTQEVFKAFAGSQGSNADLAGVPAETGALIDCLKLHPNDLTRAAIARAPIIADVLSSLEALPGVRLARMSGSGPTCFALFASAGDAASGAKRLSAEHRTWWVQPAMLG
jgi:4-diphosphocytidyl-2-C-methyl-D-erythritol kinase